MKISERELACLKAINRLHTIIMINSQDGDPARLDTDLVMYDFIDELDSISNQGVTQVDDA